MPFRLLLIDDDDVDRQAVRRSLEVSSLDSELSEAVDGQSGLKMVEREEFDCVLLDYRLPDMDGLTLLDALVERRTNRFLPIVVLTGEGSEAIAVEAMKRGAHDYLGKDSIDPPALELAIRNAMEKAALVRKNEESRQELEKLALHDQLTGLANRRLFYDRLTHALALATRRTTNVSVMMMDLDDFKQINDTLGHRIGDRALQEIGRRLKGVLRDADLLARLGGDEFALIMETGTTYEGTTATAQKINREMSAPFSIEGHDVQLALSIGIAMFPDHGSDCTTLLHQADAAMYAAKRRGLGFMFFAADDKVPLKARN